jgi:hypothetical protein
MSGDRLLGDPCLTHRDHLVKPDRARSGGTAESGFDLGTIRSCNVVQSLANRGAGQGANAGTQGRASAGITKLVTDYGTDTRAGQTAHQGTLVTAIGRPTTGGQASHQQ